MTCPKSDRFEKIFIGVELIHNVVLVSAVEPGEPVIHILISTLFQVLFPYTSLQSIEKTSLCYIAGKVTILTLTSASMQILAPRFPCAHRPSGTRCHTMKTFLPPPLCLSLLLAHRPSWVISSRALSSHSIKFI